MAHDEELRFRMLHGFTIELESPPIEPARPGFVVIVEAQPDVRKLSGSGIGAPPQIDNVSDSKGAKFFDVARGCYRAAKRQPLSNPKHLHTKLPCGARPCRPSRL